LKLYEITLRPVSGFGTTLKGDTIFGHFCWQVWHKPSLVEGGLEMLLSVYDHKPFVVFSSAFPKLNSPPGSYFLKRPDLPAAFFFHADGEKTCKERIIAEKEHRKKKWMVTEGELSIDLQKASYLTDRESLVKFAESVTDETRRQMRRLGPQELINFFPQPHNTINRLTQTTGTGPFAPFSTENTYYYPETELVVFVLIDESASSLDSVLRALENIGKWGYGRDASTGMGRFELGPSIEHPLPDTTAANAAYTLAPSVPQEDCFTASFFTAFVRFGKHGDKLAKSENPFKNPVIMADEGAVFKPEDATTFFEKPYMGRAITGVSKVRSDTVVQGYAPYLPLRLEG